MFYQAGVGSDALTKSQKLLSGMLFSPFLSPSSRLILHQCNLLCLEGTGLC